MQVERGSRHQVAVDKNTLEVFVDGQLVDSESEFVDGGTEQRFPVGRLDAVLTITQLARRGALGSRRADVSFTLDVDGHRHVPDPDDRDRDA